MTDARAHNSTLNKLQAARLARLSAAIIGASFALQGDFTGAGIMAALYACLWFAVPVTH